jgi:hypothetical protein
MDSQVQKLAVVEDPVDPHTSHLTTVGTEDPQREPHDDLARVARESGRGLQPHNLRQ